MAFNYFCEANYRFFIQQPDGFYVFGGRFAKNGGGGVNNRLTRLIAPVVAILF
jgi:hypothetical protein